MKQENNELSKLLKLDNLYSLYSKVGDSINNDIDLHNSGYDLVSRENSITLLKKCNFISEEDELYIKTRILNDIDNFSTELLKTIRVIYLDEITNNIFSLEKKYDEKRGVFYIPANKVNLRISGLVMLLDDLNFIQILANRIYILDEEEAKKAAARLDTKNTRKLISVLELEQGLAIKKILGELGEQKALEYEVNLLLKQNIEKTPKIISDVDVSAGYDMVSFLSPESESFDKYIEVKSCQDMNQQFYLSSNELKVAKEKGDSYFIYIYVREKDEIIVIRNPYQRILLSEEWAKEPQIYRIHKIINGDII